MLQKVRLVGKFPVYKERTAVTLVAESVYLPSTLGEIYPDVVMPSGESALRGWYADVYITSGTFKGFWTYVQQPSWRLLSPLEQLALEAE